MLIEIVKLKNKKRGKRRTLYLHHLVEEEDAAWREPPWVIIFTSLMR